ncbi:hypothetical protein JI721_05455 [Alicyclobacillus cycloheptanicus]|uniref:Uncharacterized protein n=1 Tax=Alicyclobacillus cycloheptanicus TaxID=1457 RepID=A0ABT9XGF6_9BACL|nr:hypothetical protein [Alicyclobacillus cycloheptanicus]MDQ0189383.1 hypothetical protein [Alicyclobacillus cycloheptanicus]WDM02259.1 hypothetical protein JI721_05455 [Alicyclobacillus cycloheptanicus]
MLRASAGDVLGWRLLGGRLPTAVVKRTLSTGVESGAGSRRRYGVDVVMAQMRSWRRDLHSNHSTRR